MYPEIFEFEGYEEKNLKSSGEWGHLKGIFSLQPVTWYSGRDYCSVCSSGVAMDLGLERGDMVRMELEPLPK